ncbi:MAG: hypothetical protein ACTH45_09535, partial [Lactobacillus helveticus]
HAKAAAADSLKTNLRDKKPDPIWIRLVLVLSSFSYVNKSRYNACLLILYRLFVCLRYFFHIFFKA